MNGVPTMIALPSIAHSDHDGDDVYADWSEPIPGSTDPPALLRSFEPGIGRVEPWTDGFLGVANGNATNRGDIVVPINTGRVQDFNSIGEYFTGAPSDTSKTRAKLTNPIVHPSNPINFQDVSACVSAFRSKPFKLVVTTPPVTCP